MSWEQDIKAFSGNRETRSGGVIVLASGPSASYFPIDRFDLPVIAMNGSILKCAESEVVPEFYICDDDSFIRDRSAMAIEGAERAANLAMTRSCYSILNELHPGCLLRKNLYVLDRVNRKGDRAVISDRRYAWSIRNDEDVFSGFSIFSKKANRIGFSKNLEKGYFGSRTIPFAALQLACHLGFNKAFLVGVDLNPEAGRFYETGTRALPSTLHEDFEKYILPSFTLMSEKIVKKGEFEVFNLSLKSRLPDKIIKKITVDQMAEISRK